MEVLAEVSLERSLGGGNLDVMLVGLVPCWVPFYLWHKTSLPCKRELLYAVKTE